MDVHKCGDCESEFDSYENFLIHKLLVEKYTLTIEPSERIPELQLPRFFKINSNYELEKENEVTISNTSQPETMDAALETFHCEDLPMGTPVCDIEVETEGQLENTQFGLDIENKNVNNPEICPTKTVKSFLETLHRERDVSECIPVCDIEVETVTDSVLPGNTQYVLDLENQLQKNSNISKTESAKKITESFQSETVHNNLPVSPTEYDSIQPEETSSDNISLCSQTESLRIDEGIVEKEISSPFSNCPSELENENNQEAFCKICNRYYKNRVVLRVHEETVHCSARPYVCIMCRQSFKTKGSLVRHTRIHTGERPFSCSQCKKAFLDSGTLARHVQRIHLKQSFKQVNGMKILITRLDSSNAS